MPGPSPIDRFAALQDARQSWKVLLPLPEVLLLVLRGTPARAADFVETRRRGQVHQGLLRRLPPFKAGVPGHDALKDVINALVLAGNAARHLGSTPAAVALDTGNDTRPHTPCGRA